MLKLKPIIEQKAKEKQISKLVQNTVNQKSDEREINTTKELAKTAGVSHDTIHKVEKIEENKNSLSQNYVEPSKKG